MPFALIDGIVRIVDNSGNIVTTTQDDSKIRLDVSSAPKENSITSGTITSLQSIIQVETEGYNSRAIVITGTWSATLIVQISSDNSVTWNDCTVRDGTLNTEQGIVIPLITDEITSNGTYRPNNTGGITHIRVKASSYTSGTANITITQTAAHHSFSFGQQSIIQNVIALPLNSTTTNLSAKGIFVGQADNTLGVNAIQVSLKCSENCNIYVQQSNDGVNWDIEDKFYIDRGIGHSSTVQATGAYVRCKVENLGGKSTDYIRFQTVLCPVVEALPRSLTQEGNLKVAINENWPIITEGSDLKMYVNDNSTEQILTAILKEIRIMNMHLSVLTDDTVRYTDNFTSDI